MTTQVAARGRAGGRDEPRWLSAEQQQAWRAYLLGVARLNEALNRQLETEAEVSLSEYEILVRLSEAPDRTPADVRARRVARPLAQPPHPRRHADGARGLVARRDVPGGRPRRQLRAHRRGLRAAPGRRAPGTCGPCGRTSSTC